MHFFTCLAVLTAALALSPGAAQAAADSDEAALRAAVGSAVWPADIVRAADRYLEHHAASNGAAAVAAERERAAAAWQLVSRQDLRLYRSAFQPPPDQPAQRDELRRAALGDREAVLRLARAHRPSDEHPAALRYVGWLQYAAALGDERSAYELALHFRRTAQPVLAAQYETQALAMGFQPPPTLDHVRK